MKIIHGIEEISKSERLILTIGMFDGVHKGHQTIIEKLNEIAFKENGNSALLTFSPHPRKVLQSDDSFKLLTTLDEKIELLKDYNLDYLIIQPFDFEFSRISPLNFVRYTLVNQLNIHTLILGHDHHFGRNRAGDFSQLQELAELYHFKALQLSAILEDEKPISSTKIREALSEGNIPYANEALNHPYGISGEVIHGDKIGRTLGFPTINLKVDSDKLIPKDGVYGVNLKIDNKTFTGLMNIGFRPTIEGKNQRIEIYVLDFNHNLYGEKVSLNILCRIRDEQKFENLDCLKNQIEKDIQYFKEFLTL